MPALLYRGKNPWRSPSGCDVQTDSNYIFFKVTNA